MFATVLYTIKRGHVEKHPRAFLINVERRINTYFQISLLGTHCLLDASREIVESITLDARGESEKTRKKELAVN